MIHEVKVPAAGESITEGLLAEWYVQDGQAVKKGDPLFELESDKAGLEVTALESGVISLKVEADTEVTVGDVVATIDSEGTATAEEAPAEEPKAEAASNGSDSEKPKATEPTPAPAPASVDAPRATSVARKIADEHGLNVNQVKGTGPAGRVTREDVESAVANKGELGIGATFNSSDSVPRLPSPPPVSMRPADVSNDDRQGAPKESTREPAPKAPTPKPAAAPASSGDQPDQRRERMSMMRRRIAERLVQAQHNAAMLTTFNDVDMSAVMELRKLYKEDFKKKHGIGLGFMSFFVRAACEALKAFPRVNAFIDGDEIVYNSRHHVAVAVSAPKGLVVPVVRDADHLSFAEIEKTIYDLAVRARDGKIEISEMQGGTFTISNGGVFGSMLSTPILNPPQSGILGMHRIEDRPVAVNGQVVIRPMMYLALSYDHRIIDGKEAVSFLVRMKECLENPSRMLLDI